MAAYATISEVESGYRALTSTEQSVCSRLLEEAAVIIDSRAPNASSSAKNVVSCRMVRRALANIGASVVPMGATQGTMTAGPYSQSWTLGSNASAGELYLSSDDRKVLGIGNRIGFVPSILETDLEDDDDD